MPLEDTSEEGKEGEEGEGFVEGAKKKKLVWK
jgi:hypothetical protein